VNIEGEDGKARRKDPLRPNQNRRGISKQNKRNTDYLFSLVVRIPMGSYVVRKCRPFAELRLMVSLLLSFPPLLCS